MEQDSATPASAGSAQETRSVLLAKLTVERFGSADPARAEGPNNPNVTALPRVRTRKYRGWALASRRTR
jgi:hypothetical protein